MSALPAHGVMEAQNDPEFKAILKSLAADRTLRYAYGAQYAAAGTVYGAHIHRLATQVMIGVGGWIHRLVQEPTRLWENNPKFMWMTGVQRTGTTRQTFPPLNLPGVSARDFRGAHCSSFGPAS